MQKYTQGKARQNQAKEKEFGEKNGVGIPNDRRTTFVGTESRLCWSYAALWVKLGEALKKGDWM